MIKFILICTFIVLFLILSIPLLIAEWIIGKFNMNFKNKTSLVIVKFAFRVCIFISGARVTVLGEENIPKDTAVLYVGNHRSYFDILLTYIRVPRPTGYVAKKEMLRYPLLCNWMSNLHCLFLDRSDIKKGLQTILLGVEKLKSGISICVFPEGTRNKTADDFLTFHDGSLKMAERSGCPIVPMTLNNVAAIFEDHMPKIKRAHVIIEYGKPIYMDQLDKETRKFAGNHVKSILMETYARNKELV